MKIFIRAEEVEVIASGVRYLRIEGAFYVGIWIAIPIGWALADAVGYGYYALCRKKILES